MAARGRAGERDRAPAHAADRIAAATVQAAVRSGLAEYWHPDTGAGLGAIPQSWTGLALVMAQGSGPVGGAGV